jgi:exodeoxyribonuclease-1
MIYSGGFFPDADRREMMRVRALGPEQLASEAFAFQDARLDEMLFRYRARNWPQTLTPDERGQWDAYRLQRLTDPGAGASITIDAFRDRLKALRGELPGEADRLALLDELEDWGERVLDAEA